MLWIDGLIDDDQKIRPADRMLTAKNDFRSYFEWSVS